MRAFLALFIHISPIQYSTDMKKSKHNHTESPNGAEFNKWVYR